ncbi:FAD-dependent oxidoreductase [Dissulfurirhabdus thermomarina]|uniref:FAD-dependent oxidoreductase n=1 Tax=Dissulfurirhabdus thermomarina TaxID=1765737 RepID=A0A6N9TMF0_DISTH|nr:FAD-dependent oxidoreductase [Dissulfurirhabdus thermomarina]NDY42218.1 FAD-dependent oxidoreductase [Dissulfurirhabdus thermomarina]NMX24117.1 FAD-dependent oxidoreductase [Dissulfurirhabdus thermomarina]
MPQRIVVVGAVAAGPKVACRARRLLPDAHITLIDQDDLISYGGCGIPYYVSGDVTDEKELRETSFHVLRDARFFRDAKGIDDVRILTRVTAVDRKEKQVHIQDVQTGETGVLPYDKLVLATGSRPNVLPVEGRDLDGVFTISSLHKAIAIKERIARGQVEKAVVIGGGAIGIEMAEALTDLWGVETTIIEFMPQVLPRLVDRTLARMVEHHLREHGVQVFTGEGAQRIEGDGGRVRRVVTPNRTLEADLVIMSAGVRPRGELAREAGLLCSPMGAIVVNRRMQTSDPDIYAAGDCVETLHLVTGKKAYAPLGSVANRQGRVVADNLAGIPSTFDGVVGTFIMKVFDICVGATGLSTEVARAEGFDAAEGMAVMSDRAHFFPTQALMFLQMVADRRSRRVLGVQGVGAMGDGLMARIDAAAALLPRRPTVDDFGTMELAYAPPFSTAVDVLNTAANILDNVVSGRIATVEMAEFLDWMDDPARHPEWLVLDLRHPREAEPFLKRFPDRWMNIPYDEVRPRRDEVPRDRRLILVCNAGTRSYEIQRFLVTIGIDNTLVLPGALNVARRLGPAWWPEGTAGD